MLLARHRIDLVFQHTKRRNHARARFVRFDHIVHVATLGSDERVGEAFAELVHLLLPHRSLIGGCDQLPAIDNVDRTLRPHDGDFSGGPRQINVGAQVLGAHHAIGAAVGFPRDYSDLWNGGFGVGVE